MAGFSPVGAAPVGSIGAVGFTAANLTIAGVTPSASWVTPTYSVQTYVAAGVAGAQTGQGAPSAVSVPYPATGVVRENVAFIIVGQQFQSAGGGTISIPGGGWTQLFQNGFGGFWQAAIFYRVLNGTESGSVTVSSSGNTGNNCAFVGQMHIWTGVDPVTVFEGLISNVVADGGATSMTAAAITSTGPNRKFVNFYVLMDPSTSSVGTAGSGWTDDLHNNAQYFSADWRGIVVDEAPVAPLPTTHPAESRSKTGYRWWSYASLALLPSANQPTIFRPPNALLALAGQVTNATSDGTAQTVPAELHLSGVRAFAPGPAGLAIFGNTPHVIFPGTSGDDVVVAYVW